VFRSNKKQKEVNRKPLRIRTGDEVIVIAGKDRSKTPRKVLAVLPKEGKVIVEGVNMMMDRQKQRGGGRASGINQQDMIEKPYPIDRSNVALVDPQSRKRTRVRMKAQADGTRTRVATKSGETI
jgi:large subunit ribosomal protein L24